MKNSKLAGCTISMNSIMRTETEIMILDVISLEVEKGVSYGHKRVQEGQTLIAGDKRV